MKKYSITFGFSITVGRECRPDAADVPAPRHPFMPEPLDPLDKSADDGWLTPPEIKAVFDKRQAGAAKAAP